jgi:hypothetical protein
VLVKWRLRISNTAAQHTPLCIQISRQMQNSTLQIAAKQWAQQSAQQLYTNGVEHATAPT